jgi:hypothetical protein
MVSPAERQEHLQTLTSLLIPNIFGGELAKDAKPNDAMFKDLILNDSKIPHLLTTNILLNNSRVPTRSYQRVTAVLQISGLQDSETRECGEEMDNNGQV